MKELTLQEKMEIVNHANLIDKTLIGEYGVRFSRFFWDWCPATDKAELHYDVSWTKGSKYSTNDSVVKMFEDLKNSGYTEELNEDGENITHIFYHEFDNYVIKFDILECFD